MLRQFLEEGYLVIENGLSHEIVNSLKTELDQRFESQIKVTNMKAPLNTDFGLPFNYFPGHFQLRMPTNEDYLFKDLIQHPIAFPLIKQILGKSVYLTSYTCNANYIGSPYQPMHIDSALPYDPEVLDIVGSVGPPMQIICNYYLQDTDENNASLEVIPKTHKEYAFNAGEDGTIESKYFENKDSVRLNGKAGTLIVRDKRLWHRGTPNRSNSVRYMTSCTFTSPIMYLPQRLKFDKETDWLWDNMNFPTWNIDPCL